MTSLYSFTGGNDGGHPAAALLQGSDGYFYGTAGGGRSGAGTVFKISANRALTTLYSFTGGNDGARPEAGLVQGTDGCLYGTTEYGGKRPHQGGSGTVFKISTNGAFTILYSFTGAKDGAFPNGVVQGSNGNFYGTTCHGGTDKSGTVFKMSTDGVLTTLYSFTGGDGRFPRAGLVQGSDGNFYGATPAGGTADKGTVFEISTNGR